MRKEHEILFTPFKIGNVEIKNRIVMPPMGDIPEYDEYGVYTENAVEYYAARAKGGVGLIITGCNHVDYTLDDHSGYDHPCPTLKPAHYIRAARELTDRVHSYGAEIFIDFAIFPTSASHFQKGRNSGDYSTEEMEFLVKQTVESARIAQQAGFDGCEILDCFIHTPSYNRTDKYGGDLRGKLQFQIEIVKRIKEVCGEDFAVTNRFCLKSFMKGGEHTFAAPGEAGFEEFGRDIDGAVEAAKILLELGYPLKYYAKFREKIKAPIICSGRMENPDISAKAISDGIIDFVGVAKQ